MPPFPLEVSDGSPLLAELVDLSSLIVTGTVTEVVSLGRPNRAEDPLATEYVGVTVTVERPLAEDATEAVPATVPFAWEAYVVDGDGQRVGPIEINGLPTPGGGCPPEAQIRLRL